MTLKSKLLFTTSIKLAPPIDGGASPAGHLLPIYVTEGTFEGPKLSGRVLPGGGDWFRMRADGSGVIDVRICLETKDGAIIHLVYGGRLVIPPALIPTVLDFEKADTVDPSNYYFRTLITFETGHADHAWLNNVVGVGIGRVGGGGVHYDVYEIE